MCHGHKQMIEGNTEEAKNIMYISSMHINLRHTRWFNHDID
jgi:hypothetical protein